MAARQAKAAVREDELDFQTTADGGGPVPVDFMEDRDTFENTTIYPDRVVVDVEQARIPRNDVAKAIWTERLDENLYTHLKKSKSKWSSIYRINPYDLYLKAGWNKRNFNTLHRRTRIASLGVSIASEGVRETLIAHWEGERAFVHSGWNRLFATYYAIEVERADIRTVPVRFAEKGENDEIWNLSQLTNNGADEYEPIERALVIRDQITRFGMSRERVAKAARISVQYVDALLNALEMPHSVLEYVYDGKLKLTPAFHLWKSCGRDEQATLNKIQEGFEKAEAGGYTRVMPKHYLTEEESVQRRKTASTRSSSGRRSGGRSMAPAEPALVVPKIVEIVRRGTVISRGDDAVTVRYSAQDYDTLAVTAHIPDEGDDEMAAE